MTEVVDVTAAEDLRCGATSGADVAPLERLLAEDVTHTHATGRTDGETTDVERLRGKPRTTTRVDDLAVRLFGDGELMNGTLQNEFPPGQPGGNPTKVELHALQASVIPAGGRRLVAVAWSGSPAGG